MLAFRNESVRVAPYLSETGWGESFLHPGSVPSSQDEQMKQLQESVGHQASTRISFAGAPANDVCGPPDWSRFIDWLESQDYLTGIVLGARQRQGGARPRIAVIPTATSFLHLVRLTTSMTVILKMRRSTLGSCRCASSPLQLAPPRRCPARGDWRSGTSGSQASSAREPTLTMTSLCSGRCALAPRSWSFLAPALSSRGDAASSPGRRAALTWPPISLHQVVPQSCRSRKAHSILRRRHCDLPPMAMAIHHDNTVADIRVSKDCFLHQRRHDL